jgi:adenylylsulfate kinase-like enzyme
MAERSSVKGDGVKRVLITGMSGTGKSTVIAALVARGYTAIDADYGGLSEVIAVPDDVRTGLDPGHDWVWREDRIHALLSTDDADVLFLAGCAPNQGAFYPQFDHIILLSAPPTSSSSD